MVASKAYLKTQIISNILNMTMSASNLSTLEILKLKAETRCDIPCS